MENKITKIKHFELNWRITLAIICLALIGVGVWQFDHYFAIQKRSKVQSQIDSLNNNINDLNKRNQSLLSNDDYWMNKYFDLNANPKTEYVPYQVPSSTPTMSTCNWIGNYYHCNYY